LTASQTTYKWTKQAVSFKLDTVERNIPAALKRCSLLNITSNLYKYWCNH